MHTQDAVAAGDAGKVGCDSDDLARGRGLGDRRLIGFEPAGDECNVAALKPWQVADRQQQRGDRDQGDARSRQRPANSRLQPVRFGL